MASVDEHRLRLRDGAELFYRVWRTTTPTSKSLILFHRGHEHSGRWQETVAALGLDDVAVFAWDQRGHGHSSGERGSAPDLATVVRDAEEWVQHLIATHGVELPETIVMAHSVGAVVATAWVHDFAPPIRGLILATPAFRVKLYVPFAVPLLRLKQKLLGPGYVKSYVKSKMLTHDPEQAKLYDTDPMIFRQIAVNMLLDLYDTSTRLIADAGAVTVPLLMLAAGSDWVVDVGAQQKFFERTSSTVKQFETLPGFSHAVFHEKDRKLVVDKVRAFVQGRFAQPPATPSQLDADRRGYTFDEYERLRKPGGLRYAPVRWLMKGPGRMSDGVAVGWKHGFDSGVMLDYVYENQARGWGPLGRMIDRNFLDAIGWRGIRVRRTLLEAVLRSIIDKTHAAGRPVRILDIACGGGRYLLETLSKLNGVPFRAVLRDYKQANLDAATKLRDSLGLTNVDVVQGDAFDRESLRECYRQFPPLPPVLRGERVGVRGDSVPRGDGISEKGSAPARDAGPLTPDPSPPEYRGRGEKSWPTIAIVSGLYELFPSNEPVLRSLHGLADAIEPGGHLVYTNQPWHPQVEFISRVLTNREGESWTMRRRTQAEMDELVRSVGFEKVTQEIDPWGIFTVSAARRAGD